MMIVIQELKIVRSSQTVWNLMLGAFVGIMYSCALCGKTMLMEKVKVQRTGANGLSHLT